MARQYTLSMPFTSLSLCQPTTFDDPTTLEFHLIDSGDGSEFAPYLILGFDAISTDFASLLVTLLAKRREILKGGDGKAMEDEAIHQAQLNWIRRVEDNPSDTSGDLEKIIGSHHLRETVPICFGV